MMNVEMFKMLKLIALGVEHIHNHDIIHRDLKSDNILISRGKPKIGDFGSSQIITDPN